MKIELSVTIPIDIDDPNLDTISTIFKKVMKEFLTKFFNGILLAFAEAMIARRNEELRCPRCGNYKHIRWKTRHGETTKIITIFQRISINQLQVYCVQCNHRFYITRRLLGLAPRKIITKETREKLGLIGALASFRVSQKISRLLGWEFDKMLIWRSVQETAREIEFTVDPGEEAHGEADGTGIPIQGIKKRGKELKIFVQHKKSGGIRIAGMTIGDYDKDWSDLFKPLIPQLRKFASFLLVTDGDTGVLNVLKGKVNIRLQRCLWHIPYQFRYFLWKDGVKRKTSEWYYALSQLFDICSLRELVDDKYLIQKIVEVKKKRLQELIVYCRRTGYKNSAAYLRNSKRHMFTAIEDRMNGTTTSLVERAMRTVNSIFNYRLCRYVWKGYTIF